MKPNLPCFNDFQKPLFLVVSDDAIWCEQNLSQLGDDVIFTGTKKPNKEGVFSYNATSQIGKGAFLNVVIIPPPLNPSDLQFLVF